MGIIVLIIALLLACADQLIKLLAVEHLQGKGIVTVINKLLYLNYAENRGAAFSMLANHRWIFIVFTFIAIGALIYVVFSKKIKNKLFLASAAMIIGGGIGNLIDRIRLGYVVDYIYWSFFKPVCNFADYCITFGTALLMIYIIFYTDTLNDHKEHMPDTGEVQKTDDKSNDTGTSVDDKDNSTSNEEV